jgi:hypothetical protein
MRALIATLRMQSGSLRDVAKTIEARNRSQRRVGSFMLKLALTGGAHCRIAVRTRIMVCIALPPALMTPFPAFDRLSYTLKLKTPEQN